MDAARLHGGMFTSRTDEWATPQALFDQGNVIDVTLDTPAADIIETIKRDLRGDRVREELQDER